MLFVFSMCRLRYGRVTSIAGRIFENPNDTSFDAPPVPPAASPGARPRRGDRPAVPAPAGARAAAAAPHRHGRLPPRAPTRARAPRRRRAARRPRRPPRGRAARARLENGRGSWHVGACSPNLWRRQRVGCVRVVCFSNHLPLDVRRLFVFVRWLSSSCTARV